VTKPKIKKGKEMSLFPNLKNSISIQVLFATIQKSTDKLTQKSTSFLVLNRIKTAIKSVGMTMMAPNNLNSIIHEISLNNHNKM
jgi:hypothetical protein